MKRKNTRKNNTRKVCNLLVNSGAQLNIIKKSQIPSNIILENRKTLLSGITAKSIKILGVFKMNTDGLNIDFHVASQNLCLPYDGILGIKILTEQKLRLDKGYLQVNNNKIKLKPAHKLKKNPQKTDKEFKSRVTREQKEFLKKMLDNTDEKQNLTPVVHKDGQQVVHVNEKTENFRIEDKIEKSSCLISYEPELISKNEVNLTSEITFYDDITKVLNTIPILEAEGKDLKQKMLNEILPENVNNLHYENILEHNENNIKSLINNINIALEDNDQTINFEEVGSTDYKQFLTIIRG